MELDKPATPEPAEAPEEPSFFTIDNLTRVTVPQRERIQFPDDSRFVPVTLTWKGGITVLMDRKPGEPYETIPKSEPSTNKIVAGDAEKKEPSPPEPFAAPII